MQTWDENLQSPTIPEAERLNGETSLSDCKTINKHVSNDFAEINLRNDG